MTNTTLVEQASSVVQQFAPDAITFYGQPCLTQGLEIADILLKLQLDQETAASGVIVSAVLALTAADVSAAKIDKLCAHLPTETIIKLVKSVRQMALIPALRRQQTPDNIQLDKLRKMFLAMAADIRVVVIKLAERLCCLRHIKAMPAAAGKQLAQEILDIYAPLANRLGIKQLKWELEDLAFQYLDPKAYKNIATLLTERRSDREKYVQALIHTVQAQLNAAHVKAEISGRVKHFYSIYLKYHRKNMNFNSIYDQIGLRILVADIEDCYTALSIVHSTWSPVIKEFDDYIAHPKPNGYRSIHTAVVDPAGRYFEIQIRTHAMHEEAERGVAAHWLYKENKVQQEDSSKIDYLRQLMDWHREIDPTFKDSQGAVFVDEIYVITPAGDILDLPQGATPLDFAYRIHSEIGHRCRGAKVNGQIVPLVYTLQTGDKIEIMTTLRGGPSRDWLNAESGYIKTANARGKILQWFRQQAAKQEVVVGKQQRDNTPRAAHSKELAKHPTPSKVAGPPININIAGGSSLLTRFAKCCNPRAGDEIIGYITRGRGISVHKKSCKNIRYLLPSNRAMLLTWDK